MMKVRKQIWFQTTKTGKQTAYYFHREGMRSFRIGLDEAKLLIATGQADQIDGHPFKPRSTK